MKLESQCDCRKFNQKSAMQKVVFRYLPYVAFVMWAKGKRGDSTEEDEGQVKETWIEGKERKKIVKDRTRGISKRRLDYGKLSCRIIRSR